MAIFSAIAAGIGAVTGAIGVGGTIALGSAAVQGVSAYKSYRAGSRAAKAQKKANAIAGASEETRNRISRRNAAKDARKRKAVVQQSAENSGAGQSSGSLGAQSAISGNFSRGVAGQEGQRVATQGISAANQEFSNARQDASAWNTLSTIASSFSDFATSKTGKNIFG